MEQPTETPGPLDLERIGEDVPLFEGIRTTRAIRRLRPDPVPRELIRKVCQAGTCAPSGGNRQPWVFLAVTQAERRAFVAERYRRAFADYIAPALQAARDPAFPEARRRAGRWTSASTSSATRPRPHAEVRGTADPPSGRWRLGSPPR